MTMPRTAGNDVKDQGLGCILEHPHRIRTSVIRQWIDEIALNMELSFFVRLGVLKLYDSTQAP